MKKINRAELVSILNDISGARALTVCFASAPKMLVKSRINKVPNPFRDNVNKIRTYNCMVNFSYENSVNRQRSREGKEVNFVAQDSYGSHIGDNRIIIEHHGQLYMQVKLQKVVKSYYKNIATDRLIKPSQLEEFFSPRKPSKSQGLSSEVKVIRIKIDNITELRHAGEIYEVTD